jgi:DNA-binding Xre family transcriptional regulator
LATLKVSENQTHQTPQRVFAQNFQAAIALAIDRGQTITELAEAVGIPRTSVYDIMYKGRKVDPPEMKLWCKVLNATFEELVG